MTVHSALPERLEAAVGEVLDAAGVVHAAHGDRDTMAAAEAAAGDDEARALYGVQGSDLGPEVSMALPFALRAAGTFDEHGDPVDPPVWLWRPDREWVLRADRAL